MMAIAGLNIGLWILLWGALFRTFELAFHGDDNLLGSAARGLAVIY